MILLEREWLKCGEPEKMLAFLEGKASKRKIALFHCAATRRLGRLLSVEKRRELINILTDAEQNIEMLAGPARRFDLWLPENPIGWVGLRLPELLKLYEGSGEQWARAKLLRDIFGNPFRTVSLDPSWLTWHDGTVRKLAQVIYDEQRFQDLPILADALEEASCSDAHILNHCRQRGEHVRGCWVVDQILGKA